MPLAACWWSGRHCGLVVPGGCPSRLLSLRPCVMQATRHGIWVSNIPSAGMGNALSCAEHIFYLTLALLRR